MAPAKSHPKSTGEAAWKSRVPPRTREGWWKSKHPVFRFVTLLVLLLVAWEWFFSTEWAQRVLFEPHLRLYARLCGFALRLLGEDALVTGAIVTTSRFAVSIVKGCDAIQPVGLFIAAVWASPVSWRWKLPGMFLGALMLMFMNLTRIVILYYVGVHIDIETFEWAHRDVSQVLFVLLVVVTWVLWALWAVRRTRQGRSEDAATSGAE
jgi:exosortase/archaeosortase family protein